MPPLALGALGEVISPAVSLLDVACTPLAGFSWFRSGWVLSGAAFWVCLFSCLVAVVVAFSFLFFVSSLVSYFLHVLCCYV